MAINQLRRSDNPTRSAKMPMALSGPSPMRANLHSGFGGASSSMAGSVGDVADPGVLVASVGFGYFLGRCQLRRTDAQRLGQGPYRPRRRRGSASLQAGDGERMHARATGKFGLREELTQSNAAEIIGEGHRSSDATISGVPCKLLVESKFGRC